MSDRRIRLPEVLNLAGVKKTKLYAMVKAGEFPKPRKAGAVSAWLESEVEAWVKAAA